MRRLCRIAVLFKRPLHEVSRWPTIEIRLIEHYLSKQPAPEERIELALARLSAMYENVNRATGSPPVDTKKFLPYLNPWVQAKVDAMSGRYSDVDRSLMAAFGYKVR